MTQYGQQALRLRDLISDMLGRKLLDLTLEYQESIDARRDDYRMFAQGGQPAGRDPDTIAAEYEAALRELHTG
ncbi:hypothetical protein SEA_EYRE_27 [Gordonia phage Eyre]|uniref:Uncharacterized protein n=1 Tax=Gordonia phage Eyre TaxID=1887646 RepID=A0A1B3AZW3_9CAUD|nr:hypothetical protein BIZ73_gp27 [Gordonia phage Eyre]AOE44307.1 hypothetical protein SEA_EYRE_27 [Gordonia phage Eyre]